MGRVIVFGGLGGTTVGGMRTDCREASRKAKAEWGDKTILALYKDDKIVSPVVRQISWT